MFVSTSKQLISEIKVGFDGTLNIQNAKTQSFDEKFTEQINSAVDLLSEKQNVQVEKMMIDVADIKKATDDAKAAVTDIKKATDDAKAAALAAQLTAKQAIEKITDRKDDINKNGSSRAPSEASTEAGGAFRFSYLNAAKAQEDKAPAPRAAPALPPRAAGTPGMQKNPENDGYTLAAGGFERDTAADTMQEWLSSALIKQIPDATDAMPVYRKGSMAHVKFKTRDAVWRFFKEHSEHIGPSGAKLWFSPKSREERIYGSTLSTFKRALVSLLPADSLVTIRWDEGLVKVNETVIARISPDDHTEIEISEKQPISDKTKLPAAKINAKLAELRANTDAAVRDVTDWS